MARAKVGDEMRTPLSRPGSVSDQHAMSTPEAMIDMHGIVKIFSFRILIRAVMLGGH